MRVAVALLGILALAACAGGEGRPPLAASPSVETTLYFLTADRAAPIGVRRSIPRRSPYALEAVRALLAGPAPSERVETALPPETRLRSFRIVAREEAVVDLSGLAHDSGGVDRVRVITQLTRTLVGLSGIRRVWLRNDGKPWGLWRMDGGIADRPYDYDDLLAWFRICAAKPGTEAVPGDCFSALP